MPPRQEMNVEVPDRLAAVLVAVDDYAETLLGEAAVGGQQDFRAIQLARVPKHHGIVVRVLRGLRIQLHGLSSQPNGTFQIPGFEFDAGQPDAGSAVGIVLLQDLFARLILLALQRRDDSVDGALLVESGEEYAELTIEATDLEGKALRPAATDDRQGRLRPLHLAAPRPAGTHGAQRRHLAQRQHAGDLVQVLLVEDLVDIK